MPEHHEHLHDLHIAAVDDLKTAIMIGDDDVLQVVQHAVDSLTAYIVAKTEHSDASRHAPSGL